MTFHPLSLADRPIYERAAAQSPLFETYRGSDINFVNLFVWRRLYAIESGLLPDGTVLTRCVLNGVFFHYPPIAPTEDAFVDAIDQIEADAIRDNLPFLVRGLTARMVDVLRRAGRRYRVDEERNLFEYLYDSAALRSLAGTKYHAKRNFLNRFLKNGDHSFRPYRDADRDAVIAMLDRWEKQKLQMFEHETILEVLDRREQIGCFADLLFVGERLAAFAVGTIQGSRGITLFEKADTSFSGSYAAINYLFANAHYANVPIINRQEDLGIPELRKAKLSYHPIGFAEKYSLMRDHLDPAVLEQLRALYGEAFPEAENYVDFFFARKYRSDNVVARMQDGRVVSALHFIRKSLSVRGVEFQLPFISAAATRADARRQGHMSQVVRQALGELYNRKTVFCALASKDAAFYETFGFTSVCFRKPVAVPALAPDGRTYRAATPDDLPVLDQLYRARLEGYDVYVERKLDVWAEYLDEVLAQDGKIILVFEGDEAIGYYAEIGGAVEECVLKDDGLLPSLSGLSEKTVEREGGPEDESAAMIRIVDAVRFLETYPYDPETFCSHRIKIVDDFFPQNNVTVEWTVEEGVVRVRRIDVFDETLTIRELTERAFVTGDCPFGPVRTIIFDRY